ncbi:hypothetical protein THAOC_19011, partial [Thalassiosira oceanica]
PRYRPSSSSSSSSSSSCVGTSTDQFNSISSSILARHCNVQDLATI